MRRTVCLSKGVGAGGAAVGRAYHRSCSGRRGYRQLRPRRRQEAGRRRAVLRCLLVQAAWPATPLSHCAGWGGGELSSACEQRDCISQPVD